MNHLFLAFAILFSASFSYSQKKLYYVAQGDTIPLTGDSTSFLISTNSTFNISDLGNCKATHLVNNLYIVDDIKSINKQSGINYITARLIYNNKVEQYITKDITLKFNANVTERDRDRIYSQYNLTKIKETDNYELVSVGNNVDALSLSNQLFATGLLEFAHPDFLIKMKPCEYIPNDTYFNKQWYLHNTGQGTNDNHSTTIDADIDAPEAWEITKGSPDIVIAVIDKGVTSDHPDLPNTRQVRLNGSNFAYNYDGSGDPNNPSPTSSTQDGYNYHGDACSGIIAATQDNNEGVSGIAPLCNILPIKVTMDYFTPMTMWSDAIEFARMKGANIISCSFGVDGAPGNYSIPIINSIQNCINHGVNVVFAAGNSGDHDHLEVGYLYFPSNAAIPEIIVVGSSDRSNNVANYSPICTPSVDISTTSHTAYNPQIDGESYNIWTMDNPGDNYGQNSWRDPDPFLPAVGEVLPDYGTNFSSYTGRFGGTSASAPMVAGTLALMESVNPCLDLHSAINILMESADKVGNYNYYWNPNLFGSSQELGYGKLNTYRAVEMAQEMNTNHFDLYTMDNAMDVGLVGANGTGGGGDKSPSIWVRNTNDGLTHFTSQNPEYNSSQPCYVYVKVTNKSCFTSSGQNYLNLYWSNAGTASSWPVNWNGSNASGNQIGHLLIPTLGPNESTILEFEWNLTNPYDDGTWHACLLSRIESAIDPITPYPALYDDIVENNNVSIRNVTIVDQVSGILSHFSSDVLVGNPTGEKEKYNFSIHGLLPFEHGSTIFDDAEVTLNFDDLGWQIFKTSDAFSNPGLKVLRDKQVLVIQPSVALNEITFPANTRVPINVQINFLAGKNSPTTYYEFEIAQLILTKDHDLKRVGTETFQVTKSSKEGFKADAGNNLLIERQTEAMLSAVDIGDPALYSWYDANDSLVYSGNDFIKIYDSTANYRLEVMRLEDGSKDYDSVEVEIIPHYLISISPVPASSIVSIEYDASNLHDASLRISNYNSVVMMDSPMNIEESIISIDVSNWQTGLYTISLVSNEVVLESRNISIIH